MDWSTNLADMQPPARRIQDGKKSGGRADLLLPYIDHDGHGSKPKKFATLFRKVGKVTGKDMSITQHFQFNDRLIMFIYEAATATELCLIESHMEQ